MPDNFFLYWSCEHNNLAATKIIITTSTRNSTIIISGVGEGATFESVWGGGGGALPPPTLGHDCTLKFNEEKISSCSMSATVAT